MLKLLKFVLWAPLSNDWEFVEGSHHCIEYHCRARQLINNNRFYNLYPLKHCYMDHQMAVSNLKPALERPFVKIYKLEKESTWFCEAEKYELSKCRPEEIINWEQKIFLIGFLKATCFCNNQIKTNEEALINIMT